MTLPPVPKATESATNCSPNDRALEPAHMPHSQHKQSLSSIDRRGSLVLDTHIDAADWDDALTRIIEWGWQHQSRYVTLCNVHSVVTASQSSDFQKVLAEADLALPDGAPVAWVLRHSGHPNQERINGPDLTWRYLASAEKLGQSVFFFGSSDHTLAQLKARISAAFPELKVVGMVSPPFRELTPDEDKAYIEQINHSGAHVVFVGLGCPKQEVWMAQHRGKINAVMLGVGAAFDYHAGTIQRAPTWMQRAGLEWFHRLCSEPRRLAKRYAVTNTLFIYRTMKAMLLERDRPSLGNRQ